MSKRPNRIMSVPPEDDTLATQIFHLTEAIMYLADKLPAPTLESGGALGCTG